ncbi:XF1762 family protein [Streptomyces sp. NPDC057654]|uniref:XF1762 family protein n=1 Tax=Streptomyces sp. NPDC057654 TaxID=3346196 RepID=UPI00368F0836
MLRAVAIVGRPVARHLDDGATLEVTRTASDGTRNTNSLLYGTAWRAARALGYRRLITYTQAGESGASLRSAGWRILAHRPPRPGRHTPSRPRTDRGTAHTARTLWQAP